jgi:hypothetical protein
VRLIKLDLEGAETAALRGAQRLLREIGPDFLVELEPEHLARQGTSAAEVIGLFEAHGYRFFTVDADEREGMRLTPEPNPGGGGTRPNVLASRDPERLGLVRHGK